MTAPIIKHAETWEVADDRDHPIPALGVLDMNVIKKDGGADLHVIIASPLSADEYSQKRLLGKIEGYLEFIASEYFKSEAGDPRPDNTTIVVDLHADSDPEIFQLLERCKPWMLENRAMLEVRPLDTSESGQMAAE